MNDGFAINGNFVPNVAEIVPEAAHPPLNAALVSPSTEENKRCVMVVLMQTL